MDLAPILTASTAIQVHLICALIAVGLVCFIALLPRGGHWHKFLGRVWVAFMCVTAVSSFWISEINHFMGFSAIHLLSVFTLYSCWHGVSAIRRGNIKTHRLAMVSMVIGGLISAGGFAFMPDRIMHRIFF